MVNEELIARLRNGLENVMRPAVTGGERAAWLRSNGPDLFIILAALESRPAPTEEWAKAILSEEGIEVMGGSMAYRASIATGDAIIRAMLRFATETQPVAGGERLNMSAESVKETAESEHVDGGEQLPAGEFVMVPREPTEAMVVAGHAQWLKMREATGYSLGEQHSGVYKAMIAAAQPAKHPLVAMVELDEELEEQHPGWMTGEIAATPKPTAPERANALEEAARVADHWSEPGAKVMSAMYGLTDAEHEIARRTAEGIAETIRSRSASPPEVVEKQPTR